MTETFAAEVGFKSGHIIVPDSNDYTVLLTQTCDLQRTNFESPFCQIAPVIGAEDAFVREVSRGRRPGFVWLPWFRNGEMVGDLSRITTLERSVLVETVELGRPRNDLEATHFAESVSRHFTRVALPNSVSEVLRPFLQKMKEKYDRNSPEGECIGKIASLRIEGTPSLSSAKPDLRVLVVLEAEYLPTLEKSVELSDEHIDQLIGFGVARVAEILKKEIDPIKLREAWTALAELWLEGTRRLVETSNDLGSVDCEVINGDEFSFARSRNAPELDLAYLTTRAA